MPMLESYRTTSPGAKFKQKPPESPPIPLARHRSCVLPSGSSVRLWRLAMRQDGIDGKRKGELRHHPPSASSFVKVSKWEQCYLTPTPSLPTPHDR